MAHSRRATYKLEPEQRRKEAYPRREGETPELSRRCAATESLRMGLTAQPQHHKPRVITQHPNHGPRTCSLGTGSGRWPAGRGGMASRVRCFRPLPYRGMTLSCATPALHTGHSLCPDSSHCHHHHHVATTYRMTVKTMHASLHMPARKQSGHTRYRQAQLKRNANAKRQQATRTRNTSTV